MGFKEIQGLWNNNALMPWQVELELLGLSRRFGINSPVLYYFL
jgi:hypothetical protein